MSEEEVHVCQNEFVESIGQECQLGKTILGVEDGNYDSLAVSEGGRSDFSLERSPSEESFNQNDQNELYNNNPAKDDPNYLLCLFMVSSTSPISDIDNDLAQVDPSWEDQLSMKQEISVVEEPKVIEEFQRKSSSQSPEKPIPQIEVNYQPQSMIATVKPLEQRFRNLFVLNELPAVVDCLFLRAARDLLIDKNLKAVRGEGIEGYPLKKKKPVQLTNKVNGFVRKEIKNLANANIQAVYGADAAQVQKFLDTPDLKTTSRNTLLSNEELFSLVFTQEFFDRIFAKLEKKSSSQLDLLVTRADKAMSNPDNKAEVNEFISKCDKKFRAKLPFTRMENYCSINLYLDEFLYALKFQSGVAPKKKISVITEIKAHFEQRMLQERMYLPDGVDYPTNKQRNKKSEKGADYKAFLIITPSDQCHPPVRLLP